MSYVNKRRTARHLLAASALMLMFNPHALAGPGAHGPNGEHLDAPATARERRRQLAAPGGRV